MVLFKALLLVQNQSRDITKFSYLKWAVDQGWMKSGFFFWKYLKILYSSLLKGMNIYSRVSDEYIASHQSSSSIHSKNDKLNFPSLSQNTFCENVAQSSLQKQIIFNNNFLRYLRFPGSIILTLKYFNRIISWRSNTSVDSNFVIKMDLGTKCLTHRLRRPISLFSSHIYGESQKEAHSEENSE